MADHGSTIVDLLDQRGVMLNIPPNKVNDQLTPIEPTTTQRIANLRIHIERAVSRIKHLKLLGNIPNVMARIADQFFCLCHAF